MNFLAGLSIIQLELVAMPHHELVQVGQRVHEPIGIVSEGHRIHHSAGVGAEHFDLLLRQHK